jgi:hypothetical protein
VDGTLDVPAELLTDRPTEQNLSAFSRRAQGVKESKPDPGKAGPASTGPASTDQGSADQESNPSGDVVSSLKGQVRIRNGVLSTQRMTFEMPGASVDLAGSFNFRDHMVHLNGDLHMQSDISHAATGFKSVLMKPLIPFFKKDKAGAVVPIVVSGSPGTYQVTQDILQKK